MIGLLRNSSIFKTLILTITLSLSITIIIILSVSFTILYKQQLDDIEDKMVQTTYIADQFVTSTLSSSLNSAFYISNQLTQISMEDVHSLFKHSVHSSHLYQDILLYDLDGNVLEHYLKNSDHNLIGENFSYRPFFQAIAYEKLPFYISDHFITTTNQNVIAVSVGVYNKDQHLIGVMNLGINLTELNQLENLKSISLSNGLVYIVDRNGTIIQHPDPNLIGTEMKDEEYVQAVINQQNGSTFIEKSSMGKSFVYFFPNSLTKWGVIGVLPTQSIWEPIYHFMLILTGILLILMLALLWITIWLSAKILHPLFQLTNELQKVNQEEANLLDFKVHKDLRPLFSTYNRMLSSIYRNNKKMKDQIYIDPLTKLYNRRYLDIVIEELLEMSIKNRNPFAILIFDIDYFKNYNDTLGHLEGDDLLISLGEQLRQFFRAHDKVFRTGGEEFLVILQNCVKEDAIQRGKELSEFISAFPFKGGEIQPFGRLTISLGVATFPEDSESVSELIFKADQACYEAKEKGRNQVVIAK